MKQQDNKWYFVNYQVTLPPTISHPTESRCLGTLIHDLFTASFFTPNRFAKNNAHTHRFFNLQKKPQTSKLVCGFKVVVFTYG